MPLPLPEELRRILLETPGLERAYLVGGCVRNWLLDVPEEDFDVEVYGMGYEALVSALSKWGRTDLVGRSFGVVKLTTQSGLAYDFTVPRRDSKTGSGHKGFEAELSPDIDPRDAAGRRDFTINAMMYDPHREAVLDFFDGRKDLQRRTLRHTTGAFVEDPLRVLRGMQLAGRFELQIDPDTAALSRSIRDDYRQLALERVWDEWFKWAGKSRRPSYGLRLLEATGWLAHYPELEVLQETPQEPEWHPEGDVFVHTCHCCDALAELEGWRALPQSDRAVLMLGVLTHDIGKPLVTEEAERGGRRRIISPGHDVVGGEVAERFLERIHAPSSVKARVVPLVVNHMMHLQSATERAVRRLARRLTPETIQGLSLVMTADHYGRPPFPAVLPDSIRHLCEMAETLSVMDEAPKPILMGRHLLRCGFKPGPELGRVLDQVFEAQLEGRFARLSEVRAWLLSEEAPPLPDEVRSRLEESADDLFENEETHP